MRTKSIYFALIMTVIPGVCVAEKPAIAPLQIFDAVIVQHSGFTDKEAPAEIPFSFTIIKKGFKNKGQLGSNRAVWNLSDSSQCEGAIDIPGFESSLSLPVGSEGKFSAVCGNALLVEGKLVEVESLMEGEFLSIWKGSGLGKIIAPFVDKKTESVADAQLTSDPNKVEFTLKIKRKGK